MKSLHELLVEADPLRVEPPLSDAEAQTMRRTVLAPTARREPAITFWPGAVPVAALVVMMIVAGAAAGRRLEPPEPVTTKAVVGLERAPETERTQVQFATPGGTRIIWTLDPHFDLGVMP